MPSDVQTRRTEVRSRISRCQTARAHEKGHIPPITKPTDIVPLVQAINNYKSPITTAALKLTMLTGLRPGVSQRHRDLKAGEWHVLAVRMKTRHDHIVPLPDIDESSRTALRFGQCPVRFVERVGMVLEHTEV